METFLASPAARDGVAVVTIPVLRGTAPWTVFLCLGTGLFV